MFKRLIGKVNQRNQFLEKQSRNSGVRTETVRIRLRTITRTVLALLLLFQTFKELPVSSLGYDAAGFDAVTLKGHANENCTNPVCRKYLSENLKSAHVSTDQQESFSQTRLIVVGQ